MSDRLHIADDDITLYAMGALSAAEMEAAERHLARCARCKEALRENLLALAAYAQTTVEVEPPSGARERFMARLGERPVAGAEPKTIRFTWRGWFRGGSPQWSGALAGALALALLVVGVDDLRKRAEIGPLAAEAQREEFNAAQLAQLTELLTSPQVKHVSLHQAPVTVPPPEGRVVYAAHNGKLLLTAQNLKPLPAGKIYELWILQPGGKAPLAAGTFAPDSGGNAAMILADEPANLAVAGFGVTVENAGGSATPTLPIVLSGL